MAEDSEGGDKTELPTDRRREEVRERGNVARSTDLAVAASIVSAAAVLYFFGTGIATSQVNVLRTSLSAPAWTSIELGTLSIELWRLAGSVAAAVLPRLALVVVFAVGFIVAHVGVFITIEYISSHFYRINQLAGATQAYDVTLTV